MHIQVRRFFTDHDGKLAVIQPPNIPIIGWFVCRVAAKLIDSNPFHSGLTQLGTAFLFLWAYLEIRSGLSPFRRVLGVIIGLLTVYSYFK